MTEAQGMETALGKCCDVAKFAIEKYDDLANKYQHLLIEFEDAQQCFNIQQEKQQLSRESLKRAQKQITKL